MKVITILAGGFSASRVDLKKLPGFVIAVNDSAIYAPRIDAIVSMDRLWAENRFAQVSKFGKPIYLRSSTVRNIPAEDVSLCVTLFDNDHKATALSDVPGRLDGTHSGFCALNLAFQMCPERLYLVGFDMALGPKGQRHWFPDYPWSNGGGSSGGKLAEWAGQFRTAAAQLANAGIQTLAVSNPWASSNATIRGVLSNGRLQIATFVANAFGNGTLTIAGTGAQYRLVDWTVVR